MAMSPETYKKRKAAAKQDENEKTVFVLQVQERKNSKWEDDDGNYYYGPMSSQDRDGSFKTEKNAVAALKGIRQDTIGEAKADHEESLRYSGLREQIFVTPGSDLNALIDELKKAHKKVNPAAKKVKEFDPESVWPKFRIVKRVSTDEPLDV